MIEIKEIFPLQNKSERKEFVALAFDLHAHDKNFVAQPRLAQNEMFDPSHPFYKTATVRFWLAKKNNKNVGRVAGIINNAHNNKHNEKIIFFGFHNFVDDTEVAHKLLQTVEAYGAQEQMHVLRGPVNPSTNYEAACLVSGESEPPQVMMTYNPQYYVKAYEDYDLKKSMDFHAYRRDINIPMQDIINKISARAEKSHSITYRSISKKTWDNDIQIMHELYNGSWNDNWGFIPMTTDEFLHTAKDLKQILDEDFIIFAEVKGKPVGFAVALPDINQALIKLKNGRLFPFGIFHLLRAKKYMNRFRVITLGILPEYRKLAISALLYRKLWEVAKSKNYQEVECSWVLETNTEMIAPLKKMGAELYKTYRIYEKDITP